MSLDIYLRNKEDNSVWDGNITHNMNTMAMHVPVVGAGDDNDTLYKVLWRPEECSLKYDKAKDLVCDLLFGITFMIDNKKHLLKYNPENGWGTYDTLLSFTKDYLRACLDYPDCSIDVSR